jgi:hypothetical protein
MWSNPPVFSGKEDLFMTPSRLLRWAALVVIVGVAFLMGAKKWTDSEANTACPSQGSQDEMCCSIYSLKECGGDGNFGKWVAEVIPEVVARGEWDNERCVRFNADRGILVVYQKAWVQGKVEAFVKDLQKSQASGKCCDRPNCCVLLTKSGTGTGCCMAGSNCCEKSGCCTTHAGCCEKTGCCTAQAKCCDKPGCCTASTKCCDKAGCCTTHAKCCDRPDCCVQRADYQERVGCTGCCDQNTGYPVPKCAKQPKHLFHFIIRYEGDGIVDDHVADVIKAQIMKKAADEKADADAQAKPTPPACVPGCVAPTCPIPSTNATPEDSQPKEQKNDKTAPGDALTPSDPPPVPAGSPGDVDKK